MGYYISQRFNEGEFFLSKDNFSGALEAIQKMHGVGSRFSWVDKDFYQINDLVKILEEWRWSISLDEEGNINSIEFDGEKLGDDKILFQTIAPYVKSGSFIAMSGEQGEWWNWAFNEGKLETIYVPTQFEKHENI